MPISFPRTCPGGLHRLDWIIDGEIAICKNGHEGIVWVVAGQNRLRCETNAVARTLASFISENRIIRQNPTEDQVAVSLEIAENIAAYEEIDASLVTGSSFLHLMMKGDNVASRDQVTVQTEAFKGQKIAHGQKRPKAAPVAKPQKVRVGRAIRTKEGVLRGKRDNIQFLPAGVICRSREEYKEWREAVKMPQRDVAKILLLSRGLVSDIDIGRRPYSTFVAYQFSMYISGRDVHDNGKPRTHSSAVKASLS